MGREVGFGVHRTLTSLRAGKASTSVTRTKASFPQAVRVTGEATCQSCALDQTWPSPEALVTSGQERGRVEVAPSARACWKARRAGCTERSGCRRTLQASVGGRAAPRSSLAACRNLHFISMSFTKMLKVGKSRVRSKMLDELTSDRRDAP